MIAATFLCFSGCLSNNTAKTATWGNLLTYEEIDGAIYAIHYFVYGEPSGDWKRCVLLVREVEKKSDWPFQFHHLRFSGDELCVNEVKYRISSPQNLIVFNDANGNLYEVTVKQTDSSNCLNQDRLNNRDLVALWNELQKEDHKKILYAQRELPE